MCPYMRMVGKILSNIACPYKVVLYCKMDDVLLGGQSGAAVRRPHGMHQDMGSNPAAARNEKTDIGQTPAQKVPQKSGRISVEDRLCKAELDL